MQQSVGALGESCNQGKGKGIVFSREMKIEAIDFIDLVIFDQP